MKVKRGYIRIGTMTNTLKPDWWVAFLQDFKRESSIGIFRDGVHTGKTQIVGIHPQFEEIDDEDDLPFYIVDGLGVRQAIDDNS